MKKLSDITADTRKAQRAERRIISSYYEVDLSHGAHGSMGVVVADISAPKITVTETKNRDGYSKSCKYPMVERHVRLILPKHKKGHKGLPLGLDGCDNLVSARRVGRSDTYECLSVKKGAGISYDIVKHYIAMIDGVTYRHDTIEGARKGLARKVKRLESKKEKNA